MNGLSSSEVKNLQEKFGKNEITRKKKKTKFEIIVEIFKDPIIIIMLVAAIISLITGLMEGHISEFIVITSLVVFNVVISFVQEVKTIEKLESLDRMNEGLANVIRDGKDTEIKASDLVVGDIVKLKIGTIARADMVIVSQNNLQVDEAFLTGESIEVNKEVEEEVFSNSMIKNGEAIGRVIAIGMDTKIGSIARDVDSVETTKSQLEIKLLGISKILLKVAVFFSILIFILSMLNGLGLAESLSMTISILIATVPEGLATVLTIVLTLMSTNMSKNNALIKKVSLLETLGEVSYVCSDKTGTITLNEMKVTDVLNVEESLVIDKITSLVIDRENPTARAIHNYIDISKTTLNGEIIDRIPFNSSTKMAKNLVKIEDEFYYVLVGAPDYLVQDIEVKYPEFLQFGKKGLRTLAISILKVDASFDINENDAVCDLVTLYGISDPPKESAIKAIEELHSAGINVVMITGDNIQTASAIAKQTNIMSGNDLSLTGDELDKLSEQEFMDIVKSVRVYARVSPEHKHKIVSALQAHGEIVAMTGDGTNDSIALKQANVGIAMGINGTDISKESADLILLDDNFTTINVAVESGRLIFDNLKKFIRQMLTSNTAHTGSILFALIFGIVMSGKDILIPMTPVLILWVNIISDAIPCLALGVDNKESDLMQREPIDPNAGILTKGMIIEILIRGLSIGLLVFISFNVVYSNTMDETMARTVGFVVLSFGQLAHIFDARSFNTLYKKNPFNNKLLLCAVGASSLLNLLIIYTPLNAVFGLVPIALPMLLIAILVAVSLTFVLSAIKLLFVK